MKCYLVFLFLLIFSAVYSQDANFSIGTKHHLYSKVLHEERTFYISLPEGYHNDKYVPAKYPVVYLLDAESNFHSFTGILQSLTKGPYAPVPPMIVVGVVNTDRTRDLTPTAAGRAAYYDNKKALFTNSGGNEQFIRFLVEELRGYIDSACRTTGYNILNGHSFGGLTATNILLNKTSLFNAYIIIDPSLWWDNELMLRLGDSLLPIKNFDQRTVYLAKAHKEIIPQDTTTDHPASIQRFYEKLQTMKPARLRWQFKYYDDEDHGTVSVPAEFDGLKYIFDGYKVNVKQATEDTAILRQHLYKVSDNLGVTIVPTEAYLDWLGNYCLSINKITSALYYFGLEKQYYPTSRNVDEALKKILVLENKQ